VANKTFADYRRRGAGVHVGGVWATGLPATFPARASTWRAAQRQQKRVIEITPKARAIYDRNMHPLAMSLQVDSTFAIPSELG